MSDFKTLYPASCDNKRLGPDVIHEQKIDGHRGLLHFGGDCTEAHFTSRFDSSVTGKPSDNALNIPHISKDAFEFGQTYEYGYTVLDGEVDVPGHPFECVQTVMGSDPDKSVMWQMENGYARFTVFDVLFLDGKDVRVLPLASRKHLLKVLFFGEDMFGCVSDWIQLIEYTSTRSWDDVEAAFEDAVARGEEGIVVKDLECPYGKGWRKLKVEKTYDVIVMGFQEGRGEFKEMVGSLEFGLYDPETQEVEYLGRCSGMAGGNFEWVTDYTEDGSVVPCKPRQQGSWMRIVGEDQPEGSRAWFTLNQDSILGTVIEIGCKGLTAKGKPRHPQFKRLRPDKPATECVALTV